MDQTNTRAIYVSRSNSLKSAAECVTDDLTDSQKGHLGIKSPSLFQRKLILRTFHCATFVTLPVVTIKDNSDKHLNAMRKMSFFSYATDVFEFQSGIPHSSWSSPSPVSWYPWQHSISYI